MLVGYDKNSTNYRLYDVETKKIKVSRNVSFNEDVAVPVKRENIAIVIFESDTNETQCQQSVRSPGRNISPREENLLENQQQRDF